MPTKFWIAAAAVAVLATACSSGSTTPAARPAGGGSTSAPGTAVTIGVAGGRLTAPDGHTLYYNTVDTAAKISCVASCASLWPPLTGAAQPGSGVDDGSLASATRPDGGRQVTFDGHPLYEFSGDTAAGSANGDGMADQGGRWLVATSAAGASTPTRAPNTAVAPAPGGYNY